MDYFLPREEDIPRLDDVFQRAVGPEVEEKVEEMTRENATDPRIDEIFPVSEPLLETSTLRSCSEYPLRSSTDIRNGQ